MSKRSDDIELREAQADYMGTFAKDLHDHGDSVAARSILRSLETLRDEDKLTAECLMQFLMMVGGAGIVSVKHLRPSLVDRIRDIMGTPFCRGCGKSVSVDSQDAMRFGKAGWCHNDECEAKATKADFANDTEAIRKRYQKACHDAIDPDEHPTIAAIGVEVQVEVPTAIEDLDAIDELIEDAEKCHCGANVVPGTATCFIHAPGYKQL